MSNKKTGHVLKFEDGQYYIEVEPYVTPNLDEAEIYFKYFDLMEAQARALRNTGHPAHMTKISFRIADITVL